MSRKTGARRNAPSRYNKIAEAVLLTKIRADIDALRTQAELHAFIGGNCPELINKVGRLVYIVCFAAGEHAMGEWPEARILAGTANALAELHEQHASLERQRATLIAGLAAAERLMPELSTRALMYGSLQLDAMLASSAGMGTSDVRAALMQAEVVA
jgi:hypothetical protein